MNNIQQAGKWLFLGFMVFMMGENSLSFAQTNTFPSSGNVGIGTTTPDKKLRVKDATFIIRLILIATLVLLLWNPPTQGQVQL